MLGWPQCAVAPTVLSRSTTPKRSRNCPHCRRPFVVRRGQLLTPEAAEKLDAKSQEDREIQRAKRAKERFRNGRRSAAAAIREAKKTDFVVGFKPLVSDDACEVCLAVRERFLPIESCTAEMLPPYANCRLEYGCESTFTQVLDTDIEGSSTLRSQGRKSKVRKSRKLRFWGIIFIIVIVYIVWKFLL